MSKIVTNGRNRAGRKYSLLAASGILVITVIRVPVLVDLWGQMDSQRADRQQMLVSMDDGSPGRMAIEQLTEVQQELAEIKGTMVAAEQMPAIQSQLIELARSSGCQLRKAVVQSGTSETWEMERGEEPELEPDVVDATAPASAQSPPNSLPSSLMNRLGEDQPYALVTEQIGLTFNGTLKQSFDFLDQARQAPWLMSIAQIKLTRQADNDGQMVVEASLAFHRLERKEKE